MPARSQGPGACPNLRGVTTDGTYTYLACNGGNVVLVFTIGGNPVQISPFTQIWGFDKPFAVAMGGPNHHLFVGQAGRSGKLVKEYAIGPIQLVGEKFDPAVPGPVRDDALRGGPTATAGRTTISEPGPAGASRWTPPAISSSLIN